MTCCKCDCVLSPFPFSSNLLLFPYLQTKERAYSSEEKRRLLARFQKQVSLLHEQFDHRLSKEERSHCKSIDKLNKKLLSANTELDSNEYYIPALKEHHRQSLKKMTAVHAAELHQKNSKIKAANDLVAGMQEMFDEMSKEVIDATTAAEKSSTSLAVAKQKAAEAHAKFIEHKLLAGELTDEIVFVDCASADMEADLEQSREMIDYLYRLEEQQSDFKQVVQYIDKYYAEEVAQPKCIAKHLVSNKDGKGGVNCISESKSKLHPPLPPSLIIVVPTFTINILSLPNHTCIRETQRMAAPC